MKASIQQNYCIFVSFSKQFKSQTFWASISWNHFSHSFVNGDGGDDGDDIIASKIQENESSSHIYLHSNSSKNFGSFCITSSSSWFVSAIVAVILSLFVVSVSFRCWRLWRIWNSECCCPFGWSLWWLSSQLTHIAYTFESIINFIKIFWIFIFFSSSKCAVTHINARRCVVALSKNWMVMMMMAAAVVMWMGAGGWALGYSRVKWYRRKLRSANQRRNGGGGCGCDGTMEHLYSACWAGTTTIDFSCS